MPEGTIGWQQAMYRMERGAYVEARLFPNEVSFITAEGEVVPSRYPGGYYSPEVRKNFNVHSLKSRAVGVPVTVYTSRDQLPKAE